MSMHPLAGQPAPENVLIHPEKLLSDYESRRPDCSDPAQLVSFGTSGHRGSAMAGSFNEAHILAITQAICDYRSSQGINGPLYMGKDTHALSAPAEKTALTVLAANGVETVIQENDGFTPTPAISLAILAWNANSNKGQADGIVLTPSHNPPADGGIKYNPPHGGPADSHITKWIEERANELMKNNNADVQRLSWEKALAATTTHQKDLQTPYIDALAEIIDFDVIRSANLKLGVDPMGGAGVHYWQPLAEKYQLNLTVVNPKVDPTFRFLTLDKDGKIRMDCSSPYAMAGLVHLKDKYDLAFGNDTDADRHGIVTRSVGLMNPNHYLAVAIRYLFSHRPQWPTSAGIGKTLVSSSMIDRVAKGLGKTLVEVPVGFKWFVDGLYHGTIGFGGEESAGASFLRKNGTVWTTDKDGLIMNLLAAEILARTGKDPGEHYQELTKEYGTPVYQRVDQPATLDQKKLLQNLAPENVSATTLAGDAITAKLTKAPGNNAPIGGLKVTTDFGWFAARPSGTENIYKIYAESFRDQGHLNKILDEAKDIVTKTLTGT